MKNNKVGDVKLQESKEVATHYMKTLVDVARESFLILDSNLRVIAGNPVFYQNFQVSKEETENKFLYDLGNGQWNIPTLKKLLEEILPDKKAVRNYEVSHVFQKIGQRTMVLNARQVDSVQLIIIAIEDITEKKNLEESLASYTKELEAKVAERTKELADQIKELGTLNKTMIGRELKMVELKEEIKKLEKLVKNGNGKNGKTKNGNNNHKNGFTKQSPEKT